MYSFSICKYTTESFSIHCSFYYPTSLPEIVDIEDSDEEKGLQSLQANIFNEISSPPNQATTKPTLSGVGLPEQPITE